MDRDFSFNDSEKYICPTCMRDEFNIWFDYDIGYVKFKCTHCNCIVRQKLPDGLNLPMKNFC